MPQSDWKNQLAGLQMPPEPSAWPPAPLAVVLALVILAVVAATTWAVIRRWQQSAWRRAALAELRAMSPRPDPAELSRLLRRVARAQFSARDAALGDTAFAHFLATTSGNQLPLEMAEELATCAHRPSATVDERHTQAAALWIKAC